MHGLLTEMVPCLQVFSRMRTLANRKVSACGISAESAASEGKNEVHTIRIGK